MAEDVIKGSVVKEVQPLLVDFEDVVQVVCAEVFAEIRVRLWFVIVHDGFYVLVGLPAPDVGRVAHESRAYVNVLVEEDHVLS